MEALGLDSLRAGGLLLIDKPVGPSSARVVGVIKRLLHASKVGHGGTLDPFASGLLPILVGRDFTRTADTLLAGDKAYRLTIRFGSRTDTGDLTGKVVAIGPGPLPTRDHLIASLRAFEGTIEQAPPAYSALKVRGKPMYWYARRGQTVEKAPRSVVIHRITLVEQLALDAVLDVECSKGTYMRTLAEDVGRMLGCEAHLVALRRTAVGPYRVDDAIPLWRIEQEAS